MKTLLATTLAILPAAALAQAGPYKLIITWHESNITVIDYPSLARCEQARRAVIEEVERRSRDSLAAMPPGTQIVGRSPNGAFCIPG